MGRRPECVSLWGYKLRTGSLAGGSRRHPQSFVLDIDARVAQNVAGHSATSRSKFSVELESTSYPCPNYPKSKPPAAASSRTSSAGASIACVVHDRRLRWPVDLAMVAGRRRAARSGAPAAARNTCCSKPMPARLILHLGMSGSLRVLPAATPRIAHDHVDIELDSGQTLRFNDPRRFGSLLFTAGDPAHASAAEEPRARTARR